MFQVSGGLYSFPIWGQQRYFYCNCFSIIVWASLWQPRSWSDCCITLCVVPMTTRFTSNLGESWLILFGLIWGSTRVTQNSEMLFNLFTLATFPAAGLCWRAVLWVVRDPAGGRCSSWRSCRGGAERRSVRPVGELHHSRQASSSVRGVPASQPAAAPAATGHSFLWESR